MRNKAKNATTLIEIVMALAVGMIVMIIVWGLFRMSHRMFHSTRKRLTSLQGAFMLLDRFALDMRQAVILEKTEPSITDEKQTLKFYSFDEENSSLQGPQPKVALKKFTYRRDKSSAEFKWKAGTDSEKAFKAAGFEIIIYSRPTPSQPRVPADELVTFRITCASHDDIEANKGKGDENPDRRDKEVVTLISVVGMHQKASEAVFPWWKHNRLPAFGN